MSKITPLARNHAQEFLAESAQFRLGHLTTEARHPETTQLAQWCREDLGRAVDAFHRVESAAIQTLAQKYAREVEQLKTDVERTLQAGGRIFLAGCGSTGRLSVCLEAWWREAIEATGIAKRAATSNTVGALSITDLKSRVVSFIAGGDYALVRSIESFEDHPEYGARQLRDAGFTSRDLLIASSEGGETPFVIGAVEEAMRMAPDAAPYFLFCNPREQLLSLTRCRRLLEAGLNDRVRCVSLAVGPMVLSGSTRLQASTVLTLAIGAALFSILDPEVSTAAWMDRYASLWEHLPLGDLHRLIAAEAAIYQSGGRCLHRTRRYGLTALTDTTERTPTFNLLPFENKFDLSPAPSPTYLHIPGTQTSAQAWEAILKRGPRALTWDDFQGSYGARVVNGFDFSDVGDRSQANGADHVLSIDAEDGFVVFRLHDVEWRMAQPASPLLENLMVKSVLNLCSTLLMGRVGRFESNLMLYVRSTNKKLMDRSVRYAQALLEDQGITASYEALTHLVFELQSTLPSGESVVLKSVERYLQTSTLARDSSKPTFQRQKAS